MMGLSDPMTNSRDFAGDSQAASAELEHKQLGMFLKELEKAIGPITRNELSQARLAWPKSAHKSAPSRRTEQGKNE